MADTLTFDNTTEQTSADSLTTEEQDSLQVGEQIQDQQDQLLAGKYENAQELEKAYIELQKKMGSDEEPTSEATKDEAKETQDPYEGGYLEDGTVNYEQVNETYGEQLGEIFKNSNVDPWAISKTFHENKGELPKEMFDQLVNSGLSEQSVNSYLAGRAAESGYTKTAATEISDAQIDSIQNSVGGEAAYNSILNWASDNLSKSKLASFDNLVETGNADAIQLAIDGIKAQYDNANGYEGRMLTGKAPQTSGDVFRSQAEVVKAMSDTRYDDDPAYRQDIIDKLARSDVQF